MGKEGFTPVGDENCRDIMNDEEYIQALRENPELIKGPDFITCEAENTRDFKFDNSSRASNTSTVLNINATEFSSERATEIAVEPELLIE